MRFSFVDDMSLVTYSDTTAHGLGGRAELAERQKDRGPSRVLDQVYAC